MRNKLIALLASKYPTLKRYQVHDCVNRYVDAVMQEIAFRFATITSEDIEAAEFSFAADAVNKASGQVSLLGKRPRIFTLMQLNKLRKMNDTRTFEYNEKLKDIRTQYAPPAAPAV